MFPFCNIFKVHYNTCQGYVRLANWIKEEKKCLQWIKVVKKTTTAHSQNILHVDALYNIKRKNTKRFVQNWHSPSYLRQNGHDFVYIELIILFLYLLCSWIIAIFKECLIKSRNSHCLYRYQVTLIVLD